MKPSLPHQTIEHDKFDLIYIDSGKGRIEGTIVLDREDISQKLIFIIMTIAYDYGLGCSPPIFFGPDDNTMLFYISSCLQSKTTYKKALETLVQCMEDIQLFIEQLNNQLNFSSIDLSMFGDVDLNNFYPEEMAALRDQHYEASWDLFKERLLKDENFANADLVDKCKEFENVNKKDIGLVGFQLRKLISLINDDMFNKDDFNIN